MSGKKVQITSILCEERRLLAKTYSGYKISFILRDFATIICDNNGTGKTFLFELLKNEYHLKGCNKILHFIDNTNPRDLLAIPHQDSSIVILDKVEAINAVLGEQIQYILHDLDVQCIVLCNDRNMFNYANWSYFKLVLDPHNKRITTAPTYPIEEVFPNNIPGYGGFFTHKFFLEGKE